MQSTSTVNLTSGAALSVINSPVIHPHQQKLPHRITL